MNETEFAKKITTTLNWGMTQLDDAKLARLREGRKKAMEAYREPISIMGLATVNGNILDISTWVRKPLFWLPMIAIAAAIGYVSLHQESRFDDVGELDAQLLTGELPIDAYLDNDFAAWVKESAE